jgi:hypothetical protein
MSGVARTNDENAPFEDVEQENIENRHYLHGLKDILNLVHYKIKFFSICINYYL